jgi:hypothetical protein
LALAKRTNAMEKSARTGMARARGKRA